MNCIFLFKDNKILKQKQHICDPDVLKNEVLKEMCDLRETVVTSDEPVPRLYDKKIIDLKNRGINLVANLPNYDNVKHFLYGARNKALGISKTTYKEIGEVEVPLKFHSFVLADYMYDETRILVFCSEEALHLIPKVKEYFGDGTFASCPTPFKQLYTLHGNMNSTMETTNIKPLIFALMSNRKEISYNVLFNLIKSQIPQFAPQKFHCDYELGPMNAILKSFPDIVVRGCYYHWTRNIWKKAKAYGCSKTMSDRRIVAMTAILPLIPADKILEGFHYIKQECNSNCTIDKFLKYVENYWLKVHTPNVFSVFGERHRTTNSLEGFHSKINKLINKNTVTVTRLLNVLHNISFLSLKTPAKRNKKQTANDDFILQVQMALLNGEITVDRALDKLRY